MRPLIDRTAEKFINKEGYEIEIIEYFGAKNCTIKFEDGVVVKNKCYNHIKNGAVSNPFYKSFYNVGYTGEGVYKSTENSKAFISWRNMLRRCYKEKFPTYKDVTVCEEWHNFQNFAAWFEENYVEGFELDKDILALNCKIYSPETCCFVPSEINILFTKRIEKSNQLPTGVFKHRNKFRILSYNILKSFTAPEEAFQAYKIAKEQHIKKVAEKWKNKITDKTYQGMINYKIKL